MSYQIIRSVNFGSSNGGLSTVGFTLYNNDGTLNTARTTTGVHETVANTGIYSAYVTIADSFAGSILWDTGATVPTYATDEAVDPRIGIEAGLTAQGFTTTRAGYLDTLNGLVAAVWTNATRTLSAFGFTVATNSDANVTSIKAKTDNLPADPTSTAAVSTQFGTVNTATTGIKAKTDLIPATPAAVGSAMTLDLTQSIPTSNTAQTVGDALNAARAQGFGKWVLSGTTITLYAADGSTVVRTFTLDDANNPTTRA